MREKAYWSHTIHHIPWLIKGQIILMQVLTITWVENEKNHRHYKNLLRCILCSISRLLQLWIDAIMNKFVKTSKRDNFDLKIGITQKVQIKFLQKYLNVLTIQVSNHSYYLKALDIHKNRKVPKKRTLFIWGPTHMGWKWFNNLTEIREILKSIQSELPRHLFVIFEIAK